MHLRDGHLLELVADTQLRDLRGALNQRRELTARARRRDVLERRAAREHQTDDHPGELLPERQSPDHRDQRDRVDTHVMVNDHRATNLERELGRQQRDRSPPHITGRSLLPGQIQRPADHNRHGSNRREDTRAMLDQPAEGATNQPAMLVTREQLPPQPKTPVQKPCPSIAGHAPTRNRNRANNVVVEPRSEESTRSFGTLLFRHDWHVAAPSAHRDGRGEAATPRARQ